MRKNVSLNLFRSICHDSFFHSQSIITSHQKSDDGSLGVTFLYLNGFSTPTYCLKLSHDGGDEFLATEFFRQMGLKVPTKIAWLSSSDLDFKFLSAYNASILLNQSNVLMMSYMDGKPIDRFRADSSMPIQTILNHIGQAFIYDAVIANSDRFEYWGQPNPGNVLVSHTGVTFIDQLPYALKDSELKPSLLTIQRRFRYLLMKLQQQEPFRSDSPNLDFLKEDENYLNFDANLDQILEQVLSMNRREFFHKNRIDDFKSSLVEGLLIGIKQVAELTELPYFETDVSDHMERCQSMCRQFLAKSHKLTTDGVTDLSTDNDLVNKDQLLKEFMSLSRLLETLCVS